MEGYFLTYNSTGFRYNKERLNFEMSWGICQILKFYLAVSCTTKSTVFPCSAPGQPAASYHHLCNIITMQSFEVSEPSLKLSKSVTLQFIFSFDGTHFRQWPLYMGVGLLHYLHSIMSSPKSPQGQTIKADDRGSKDVTVSLLTVVDKISHNLF